MNRSDDTPRTAAVDLAGLGVCLLITVSAFLVGFRPILNQRAEIAEQQGELLDQREEADRLIVSLTQMRQRFRETQLQVEANAIRLESTDFLNRRLAEITVLATRSGLEIDEIKPGQGLPSEHYVRVPIHLTGRGRYPSSSAFLHGLHDQLPDISVRSLKLSSPSPARHAEPEFTFELLWYAAPKQLADAG